MIIFLFNTRYKYSRTIEVYSKLIKTYQSEQLLKDKKYRQLKSVAKMLKEILTFMPCKCLKIYNLSFQAINLKYTQATIAAREKTQIDTKKKKRSNREKQFLYALIELPKQVIF